MLVCHFLSQELHRYLTNPGPEPPGLGERGTRRVALCVCPDISPADHHLRIPLRPQRAQFRSLFNWVIGNRLSRGPSRVKKWLHFSIPTLKIIRCYRECCNRGMVLTTIIAHSPIPWTMRVVLTSWMERLCVLRFDQPHGSLHCKSSEGNKFSRSDMTLLRWKTAHINHLVSFNPNLFIP